MGKVCLGNWWFEESTPPPTLHEDSLMYGLRGNRAREKTTLMPDPLRRSSFGCTTLDSRRGYGHGAPEEGPVGTLPQSAGLGKLGVAWWIFLVALDLWDHLGRRVTPMLAVYATATVVVTVAAGTRCAWYGLTGPFDAEQSPPGPGT